MAEKARCPWAGNSAPYQAYHGLEWGVPVNDHVTDCFLHRDSGGAEA